MSATRHPVVELLEHRRTAGSVPGRRDDGARVGLAVEGGGMRGIVSAGMLLALVDLGFAEVFDEVSASSAGAINAAYFLQGQRWDALSLYYTDLSGRTFIDRRRPLVGRPVVNLAFLRDSVLNGTRPIDLTAIEESGVRLSIAITNVHTQASELVSTFTSSRDLVDALVAGAWLPILAGPPVSFRGQLSLDGGVLLDHPSTAAIRGGCTHVVVLSTKYPHPMRTPKPWQRAVRRYLNSLEEGLGDVYWRHSLATVDHRAQLQELAESPASRPVLNISPRAPWPTISRLEQGMGQLLGAAREGYEAAVQVLTGTDPTTVFSILRLDR